MRISRLEIRNILSIGEVDLVFENSGLVLLDGWNHDDNKANGAGKSSVWNALSFALFDKIPRKITKSEILRDGTKSGYALVELVARDGHKWIIKRERPSKVTFWRDDLEVGVSQSEFESGVGVSYGQFLVTMYSAQIEGRKFIELNDSGKKEFLLQLMDMDDFATSKKQIDAQLKVTQFDIDKEKQSIANAQSKIDAYSESLVDAVSMQAAVLENTGKIAAYIKDIKELEKVQKPSTSHFDALELKVSKKMQVFAELTAKRSLLTTSSISASRKIEALKKADHEPDASCPHCGQDVNIVDNSLVKADSKVALEAAKQNRIAILEADMSNIHDQINHIDTDLAQKKELEDLETKIRKQKNDAFADYSDALQQISGLKSRIQLLRNNTAGFQSKLDEDAQLQAKIKDLAQQINKQKSKLDVRSKEAEILETISNMFAPTGAPAYIMDSVIDSFNEEMAQYVRMLWPNASYKLQSFRENREGDAVAKFSEELIINGHNKSIGSLSGGELRCLSLAVDFALIDVLSKRYSLSLNPIVMDEPFEGLDASSREQVIDLLEKLAVDRQIWVVDHASEAKAMFSKVVKIEKQQGISSLV